MNDQKWERNPAGTAARCNAHIREQEERIALLEAELADAQKRIVGYESSLQDAANRLDFRNRVIKLLTAAHQPPVDPAGEFR